MKIEEREFSLTEILVKTTYQVVINEDPDFQRQPIAFGAGFFLNYKNNLFFITADHNIHIEDHKLNARTGIDNHLAILNNISDKNSLSTIMTPISGFYYMEKFNITKEDFNPELFDVAISLVKRESITHLFYTDENMLDENSKSLVSPNEEKFEFLEEHIVEPSKDDHYFIYGKIRPEFKGLMLHRIPTFKNYLTYINKSGDYILLNTTEKILDYKDWAGLSGSPVLNQEGKCVGILCSILEGTNSVFVKPFKNIKPLLDVVAINEAAIKA